MALNMSSSILMQIVCKWKYFCFVFIIKILKIRITFRWQHSHKYFNNAFISDMQFLILYKHFN